METFIKIFYIKKVTCRNFAMSNVLNEENIRMRYERNEEPDELINRINNYAKDNKLKILQFETIYEYKKPEYILLSIDTSYSNP